MKRGYVLLGTDGKFLACGAVDEKDAFKGYFHWWTDLDEALVFPSRNLCEFQWSNAQSISASSVAWLQVEYEVRLVSPEEAVN